MIRLKKISQLNVSDKMKLKLINKEIHESHKKYIQRLKIEDPEAYLELRKSQKKGLEKFQKRNPDYMGKWREKNPEKYKNYNKGISRKKKQSGELKGDKN